MKSKAIIEVANRVDALPSTDEIEENPEEFTKTITRIKGIGIWTAQISIAKISKSFRVGPINDLSARREFKYFLGISDEESQNLFRRAFLWLLSGNIGRESG